MTAKRRKPVPTPGARRRAPAAAPASTPARPATNGAAPFSPGRPDAAALAAAALGPLALYVATLPRTVVLEDDGLFLMAGAHLGVAHPPGYPLYTLIVHLFTRLPFGDPAFLGHLSSAVLGALACGAVYCCARLLRASPAPALTAAWLFGVSEQFWSQAIIAEVYTLNALLFFATYALVLLGARDPRREWPLVVQPPIAWGAGLANHWPLMVLATPGPRCSPSLPVWREVLPRLPRLLAAALVAALLPYGWMVWLSHQAPLVNFYGSIDTWSELWFYVSRAGYSRRRRQPQRGVERPLGRSSAWFAADLVRQTTLPGFALALFGLCDAGPPRRPRRGPLGRRGLGRRRPSRQQPRADPAARVRLRRVPRWRCSGPIRWSATEWPPCGWRRVWSGLAGRLPGVGGGPVARGRGRACFQALRSARASCRAGGAGGGRVLVAVSASASWRANDRSQSGYAERYAEVLFDLLPQDAVLFAHGDATGPLGYYRYVEERRPDVALYNLHGLVFGNRLYDPLLPPEEKARALDRFVGSTERPVFLDLDADIRARRARPSATTAFVMEVLDEGEPGTMQLITPSAGRAVLPRAARPAAHRPMGTGRGATRFWRTTGPTWDWSSCRARRSFLEPTEPLFSRADDCYPCLTGLAAALLENPDQGGAHADRIAAWLARAQARHDHALSKGESASLPFLQGRLAELTDDATTAAARYRQSYALYPHPQNEASDALHRLGLAP